MIGEAGECSVDIHRYFGIFADTFCKKKNCQKYVPAEINTQLFLLRVPLRI